MTNSARKVIRLDPDGFNELCMCRCGPMLCNKFDTYVGRSLLKYGEYSNGEMEIFRQVLRPGSLAVEVGANIGAHTVEISKLAGPSGAVFALSSRSAWCSRRFAPILRSTNASTYSPSRRPSGRKPGPILVPAPNPARERNFGGISLPGATQGEPVPLLTLDSIELPACHLLKVDVEGMEVEVLEGARNTISKLRPIMYLENDRKERSQELLGLVLGLGYDAYWHLPPLYNPDNFAGDREDLFPGTVSGNIFCVPSELNITVNGMERIASASDTSLWEGRRAP